MYYYVYNYEYEYDSHDKVLQPLDVHMCKTTN